MAERVDITTREELEDFLKDKQIEWAQVFTMRSALRLLPIFNHAFHENHQTKIENINILSRTTRTCLISWVAQNYPTYDIKKISLTAIASYSNATSYAGFAAATALSAVYTGIDMDAYDASYAIAHDTAEVAYLIASSASDIWSAISTDATSLQSGTTPTNLAASTLWPDGEPRWTADERRALFALPIDDLDVWENWYQRISQGKSPFGFGAKADEALSLKIATQDDAFWDREFGVINGEIKGWIEEARPSLPQLESQNPSAITFNGDGHEPITIARGLAENELLNDQNAIDRHSEVLRLANAMINNFDPKERGANSAQSLINEVVLYTDSLGIAPSTANLDFLIPRGDGLRTLSAAHQNGDELSDLPPASDKYLVALDRIVKAHNVFVSLDPALARRDEALLGPDAKINLVPPESGRSFIHDAVTQGVATPEVEEALEAEAGAAPAEPDPENRASRRYSEGVKNAARILLGVVTTSLAGGYAIAKFVLANEAWFLEYFAGNPAMIETITKLIEYLSKLPLA